MASKVQVVVRLGKSIREIEGTAWSPGNRGPSTFHGVSKKALVSLALSERKTLSIPVDSLFMRQEGGVVTEVTLIPTGEFNSFQGVLTAIETLVKDAEAVPDDAATKMMKSLREKPVEWDHFNSTSLRFRVGASCRLFAEIKPGLQNGDWEIIYTFSFQNAEPS